MPTKIIDKVTHFWSKVTVAQPDDCWEWNGYRESGGYGRFWDGRHILAHRFSYELAFGQIPSGKCVMHTCDNPTCVNPQHLRVGTRDDNNKDREAKDRGANVNGDNNPSAILTPEQVREIRQKHTPGYGSLSRLAREYGISKYAIYDIVHNRSWRHLK